MVTEQDVRQVAELARLGLDESRITSLVDELNRILEHMDALSRVEGGDPDIRPVTGAAMPLREDSGPAIPLLLPPVRFAPAMREGFFIVPRLSTHETEEEGA
jgi:aspartyl-tRNA(Asn)/glutamyl-tRNA(Gln) amidotransferase subunit C